MKFKTLFLLFSITLIFFLGILVILPYYMLGTSYSETFWRTNWPLLLVWVFLFIGMNAFYFTNRRLFTLLEKEDWPALVRYLEDKVIQRGRYSPRLVRLLANSYLVLSDSAGVMSLENKTAMVKPGLVDANALVFGTARILGKDISGAVHFFENRKDTAKPAVREWMRWYHGFALLLDRQYERAGDEFSLLARVSGDGVITALSSYFLSESLALVLPEKFSEFREISSTGKKRVLDALPRQKNWQREVSSLSTEIHAAALLKYMGETGKWLYEERSAAEPDRFPELNHFLEEKPEQDEGEGPRSLSGFALFHEENAKKRSF